MNKKTYLLLTVDTEASMYKERPLDIDKMVYGRIGNEQYGISRIMDICDEFDFKGTFFTSIFEYAHYGEERIGDICRYVHQRGHDVQLHTHPNWKYDRRFMWQYTLQEQTDIIREGKEKIHQWIGVAPIAHRAGSFGADRNTLQALKGNDIPIDCSFASNYPPCKLNNNFLKENAVSFMEDVIEVPLTVFTQFRLANMKPYRHFDLNADTLSELIHIVRVAKETNLRVITLLLHSFSFLKRNKDRTKFTPNFKDLHKFKYFLKVIKHDPYVEVITIKDFYSLCKENRELVSGTDSVPNSGLIRTSVRAYKHFDKGLKNKLVVFLISSMGLVIIVLLLLLISLFNKTLK